jgi:predicted RNA-binding Zn-ribbon protein involved in translation (DUF1610 family)
MDALPPNVRPFEFKCPYCGHVITAQHEDLLLLGVRFHDLNEHDLD